MTKILEDQLNEMCLEFYRSRKKNTKLLRAIKAIIEIIYAK